MDTSKIRELALAVDEKLAEELGYDACTADQVRWITEALSDMLAPPEGSVKVRVAVGVGIHVQGTKPMVVTSGIDAFESEEGACASVFNGFDTHRGIVEAWLPPVAPVPVVQGLASPAGDEVGT